MFDTQFKHFSNWKLSSIVLFKAQHDKFSNPHRTLENMKEPVLVTSFEINIIKNKHQVHL